MNISELLGDFPLLSRMVRDRPLVYLDSGATAQKPQLVLDAERDFYMTSNAGVHRGAHALAEEATTAFEEARLRLASFVGAKPHELVWTSGATMGLNVLSLALAEISRQRGPLVIGPGHEIVVTRAEHHANLIPWQQLADRTGARLRWLDLAPDGRICTDSLNVIGEHTKLVAFTHISNVTGAISPVQQIVAAGRAVGALLVMDACQSVPHVPVDFATLDVDALAFSGHKMYGPTGVGALVARAELLAALPPVFTGGSMVEKVTMEHATFAPPPQRFEAGTQPVAQAVALAVAADWLTQVGMENVTAHEATLVPHLLDTIASVPGVRILGPTDQADRVATVSFVVDGVHPHDVSQVLDDCGIAVRTGHHCAQPLHAHFGVHASARASAGVYTSKGDIDALGVGLQRVVDFFGVGR